jgi:hypothetical protein
LNLKYFNFKIIFKEHARETEEMSESDNSDYERESGESEDDADQYFDQEISPYIDQTDYDLE